MNAQFTSANQTRRLGSAFLSLGASAAVLGLLATLGWQSGTGTSGPVITLLSANEFAAQEKSVPVPEELHAEPVSMPANADITPPEEAPQETPATNAPAPGPESDRPVTSLASASLIASEAAGANGKAGRGRQPGTATATAIATAASASSASPESASAASGASGDAYGRAVFARIKARQSYVHELARNRIEGTVTLSFVIDPRGRLRRERVVASSGIQRLDRVALDQLRDAAPFNAPPQHQARPFTIRLTYRPTKS